MEQFPLLPLHVRKVAQAGIEGPQFFPETAFSIGTVHKFIGHLAAGTLVLLEERPLDEELVGDTVAVYRFLWLRTFDPAVVVRVSRFADGRGRLFGKVAKGEAGFEIGPIDRRAEHMIGQRRMDRLQRLTTAGGFWELSSTGEDCGLDGAQWLFETAMPGHYHVASRRSPSSGPIHTLGTEMIRMSKLRIKPRNVY